MNLVCDSVIMYVWLNLILAHEFNGVDCDGHVCSFISGHVMNLVDWVRDCMIILILDLLLAHELDGMGYSSVDLLSSDWVANWEICVMDLFLHSLFSQC